MEKSTLQNYVIVPTSQSPVDTVTANSPEEAMAAFVSAMDTDVHAYFKAVPEDLLHAGSPLKPVQPTEAVITSYSYDCPVVTLHQSQQAAVEYIRNMMAAELQADIENGHEDSVLEELPDEIFGMRLTTHRFDGTYDTMEMILAQSVEVERKAPAVQPKTDRLPQLDRWKESCLRLTAAEFDEICFKLYGENISTTYSTEGFWLDGEEGEAIDDTRLIADLSNYLGVSVESFHIDDENNTNMWIVYNEKEETNG